MEWNHLPIAGGLWDQDPDLLESFRVIRNEEAKAEKEKKRKEELNKPGKHNVKNR